MRLIYELATLVEAGLSPHQARNLLLEPIAQLKGEPAKQLELTWSLASELGAPIGQTLRQLAENLDGLSELGRSRQLAYATPRLTARLIAWLPLIALVVAQLLGLNPIGTIFSNLLAMLSVIFGLGAMALANFWSKRLIAKAEPSSSDPGLFADSVAVAMLAGLPINQAIAEARQRYIKVFESEPDSQALEQIELTAEFSNRTGAAAVIILRALAIQARRDAHQHASEKIEKLSIQLLMPIALAVLPAFALLTIVPISIGFILNSG